MRGSAGVGVVLGEGSVEGGGAGKRRIKVRGIRNSRRNKRRSSSKHG